MSYTEGAHNSPADTKDRLVRIGSKYQASAPTVADGDNAYLLLDSAGRLLISGAAAHDATATGNPLRVGGVYRTAIPAVAAGDIVDLLLDAAGRLRLAFSTDTFKIIDAVAITAGTRPPPSGLRQAERRCACWAGLFHPPHPRRWSFKTAEPRAR